MKFIHFTIIQLSFALGIGIVLASFFGLSFSIAPFLLIGIGILILLWLLQKNKIDPPPFFEIATLLFFMILGYTNYQLIQPQHQKLHYSKFYTEEKSEILQILIKEVLKPSSFQDKYIGEVIQLNTNKTEGKILLNFNKDSTRTNIKVDDILLVYSSINEVKAPLNPNQFNYKKYMQNLGVYFQVEGNTKDIISIQQGNATLTGIAEKLRSYLILKLEETPIASKQKSIIEALILGERRNIDPKLYSEYTAAGAVHILAVSGLHVGIVFYLISWLFKPLEYLRYGIIVKAIFITILLWGFAFLAGLSPSVIRAVTMFSFFALARLVNRPTNSINVLFISFFFLLIFKPNWLFHVGFQLSYLAVFFILWLQPKLSMLYRPRFKIDKLFWDIITVSFAAQLGVAPLSIYYFNQFPGLFFITNLVVLPFLTILLGYGILVVVLTGLSVLPDSLAIGYNYLIKFLNQFISWIAEREAFIIKDLSLSFLKMIGVYILITSLIIWWNERIKKNGIRILLSIFIILGIASFEKFSTKESLVVFHKSRKTIIGMVTKDSLSIFHNDTVSIQNQYPIKGFRIAKRKKNKFINSIPSIFKFQNNTYILIDSLGVYPKNKNATVILHNSPQLNLERLIDSIQPKLIIADGNNYKSYVERWKNTSLKMKVPFFATGENGAYIAD